MDPLLQFLGRLHPVILHLPIGILFLLVVLEIWNWLERKFGPPMRDRRRVSLRLVVLSCLAVTAVLSSVFGWFLAMDGGYGEELLLYHRVSGIVFSVLAVWLVFIRNKPVGYTISVLVTLVTMAVAGHFGGSLTHGKDYLTGAYLAAFFPEKEEDPVAANAPVLVAKTPADFVIYDTLIHPMLETRCVSCHGEEKKQGDLRLDTYEYLMRGGDFGPSVVPGDVMDSELVLRMWLPLEDEERMPPEGKPQLTNDEIRLFEWWIETGATQTATLSEIPLPRDLEPVLFARLGLDVEPEAPLPDRDAVLARVAQVESDTGVLLQSLHPEEPWLEAVARFAGGAFGDAQLAALEPLARVIVRLDLGNTAVTNDGLAALAPFENLAELKLDGTGIGNAGLLHLKGLQNLESLNLVQTKVGNYGLGFLKGLDSLREVYVWESFVTDSGAAELQEALTDDRAIERLEAEAAALAREIERQRAQVEMGGYAAPEVEPQSLEEPEL